MLELLDCLLSIVTPRFILLLNLKVVKLVSPNIKLKKLCNGKYVRILKDPVVLLSVVPPIYINLSEILNSK